VTLSALAVVPLTAARTAFTDSTRMGIFRFKIFA
jgi:hypothetical protein